MARVNLPWFKLNVLDYDQEAFRFEGPEGRGIIISLQFAYWANRSEGLPADHKKLGKICNCPARTIKKNWNAIVKFFTLDGTGRLSSTVLDDKWQVAETKSEQARAAAKAKADKETERSSERTADAERMQRYQEKIRRDKYTDSPPIPSPPDPGGASNKRIPGTSYSSVAAEPRSGISPFKKRTFPESRQKPEGPELDVDLMSNPTFRDAVWILERELDVDDHNERDHYAVVENLRRYGSKIANQAITRVKDAVHAYNEGQKQTPVANKLAYWISCCRRLALEGHGEEASIPSEDGAPR